MKKQDCGMANLKENSKGQSVYGKQYKEPVKDGLRYPNSEVDIGKKCEINTPGNSGIHKKTGIIEEYDKSGVVVKLDNGGKVSLFADNVYVRDSKVKDGILTFRFSVYDYDSNRLLDITVSGGTEGNIIEKAQRELRKQGANPRNTDIRELWVNGKKIDASRVSGPITSTSNIVLVRDLFHSTEVHDGIQKEGNGYVNKGKEGSHGKFATKEGARKQQKAMFANGYKGDSAIKDTKWTVSKLNSDIDYYISNLPKDDYKQNLESLLSGLKANEPSFSEISSSEKQQVARKIEQALSKVRDKKMKDKAFLVKKDGKQHIVYAKDSFEAVKKLTARDTKTKDDFSQVYKGYRIERIGSKGDWFVSDNSRYKEYDKSFSIEDIKKDIDNHGMSMATRFDDKKSALLDATGYGASGIIYQNGDMIVIENNERPGIYLTLRKDQWNGDKNYNGAGIVGVSLRIAKEDCDHQALISKLEKKYGKEEGLRRYRAGAKDAKDSVLTRSDIDTMYKTIQQFWNKALQAGDRQTAAKLSNMMSELTFMYGRNTKDSAVKDSLGEDLKKYQEWVDYDMKRYGKISEKTNEELKKAGLKVVKDKYGDYEVMV